MTRRDADWSKTKTVVVITVLGRVVGIAVGLSQPRKDFFNPEKLDKPQPQHTVTPEPNVPEDSVPVKEIPKTIVIEDKVYQSPKYPSGTYANWSCVSPKRRTPSECMTWRKARFGLFR
jgi:hypothetical protein